MTAWYQSVFRVQDSGSKLEALTTLRRRTRETDGLISDSQIGTCLFWSGGDLTTDSALKVTIKCSNYWHLGQNASLQMDKETPPLHFTTVSLQGINSNTVHARAASFIWVLKGDNNFIFHKPVHFALNCVYLDVSHLIIFIRKWLCFLASKLNWLLNKTELFIDQETKVGLMDSLEKLTHCMQ